MTLSQYTDADGGTRTLINNTRVMKRGNMRHAVEYVTSDPSGRKSLVLFDTETDYDRTVRSFALSGGGHENVERYTQSFYEKQKSDFIIEAGIADHEIPAATAEQRQLPGGRSRAFADRLFEEKFTNFRFIRRNVRTEGQMLLEMHAEMTKRLGPKTLLAAQNAGFDLGVITERASLLAVAPSEPNRSMWTVKQSWTVGTSRRFGTTLPSPPTLRRGRVLPDSNRRLRQTPGPFWNRGAAWNGRSVTRCDGKSKEIKAEDP